MSFAAFLLCLCCLLVGLGVGWACAFFYWPPGLYARLSIWFARKQQSPSDAEVLAAIHKAAQAGQDER